MKLEITPEERDELIRLVDKSYDETRVGVRRTRTPDFHDQLQKEEEVLRSLHGKLHQLTEVSTPL